jgi:small subunit ribosomal protein S17
MELKELKTKKISELHNILADLRDKSRELRFKDSNKQLKNVRSIREIKKEIAQVLTLINKEKNNIVAEKKPIIRKKFSGVVVSDKSEKTAVVKVERVKMSSKYKKRYVVSKKYKVHDEKNSCKIGDQVSFVECRPMSKDKKWRIV